jgi:hypothetical protein
MRDSTVIGRRPSETRRFLSLAVRARAAAASPLAWILAGQVALHLVGIGWGLPASDGWDNDGVAPRDFLAGIVATLSPGQYFRYPPVHLALLTVLNGPVAAVALARARSWAPADVVAAFIAVPCMTAFAVVARVVAIAMAAGLAWALAKTAEVIGGKGAGLWTAAFVGVGVPLVYYGQTSNLDVPYLFWGCLAVLAAVRAVGRGEPGLLRRSAVFAALSVGTKDQAYALFLLSVPVGLLLCAALDGATWGKGGRARASAARALAWGIGTLVVVDGPLYNPQGFLRRLAYLAGPASAPFAPYSDDAIGRLAVVGDVATGFTTAYPVVFAIPVAVGLARVLRDARQGGPRFVAGSVPLLVALSFTLTFNCVARRADPRFVLAQMAMLSVYGGIGVDALLAAGRGSARRRALRAAVLAAFAWALFRAVDVEVNLVCDPRYDAEAWMRSHFRPPDRVETYGLNVYLPRFPAGARVERVGPEPAAGRSPLPGVDEVQGSLDDAPARGARFLVVPEAWAGRYLLGAQTPSAGGHAPAQAQVESAADRDACSFFQALRDDPGSRGYRLVHTASWSHPWWPPLDLHASTARPVWIYERDDGRDRSESQ